MRLSLALTTICVFTLRRWFFDFAVRVLSWTGMRVPSTIHSSRRSVGGGPRSAAGCGAGRSMTRWTAESELPDREASCAIVGFVR
jgi:hypothetical protein